MIALEKKLIRIRENPIQTMKQTSKKKKKKEKMTVSYQPSLNARVPFLEEITLFFFQSTQRFFKEKLRFGYYI